MEVEQLCRLSQFEGGKGVGYLRACIGRVWRCGGGSPAGLLPFRSGGRGRTAPPPWKDALGGLLVGSQSFAMRVRRLLVDRQVDQEVPQLQCFRARPSLDRIVAVVAAHFGCGPGGWLPGTRSDGMDRAAAAYLARRRFGYPMVAIAKVLGYKGHGSVRTAVARVEAAGKGFQQTLATLEKHLANS